MISKYDDIINLEYHKSKRHPNMTNYNRAAQFAPFAALTGYEDMIDEDGRYVDKKIELTNEKKEEISDKINYLYQTKKQASFTYFVKDDLKDGGEYKTIVSSIKKIDLNSGIIMLTNKDYFNIEDLLEIEIIIDKE